MNEQDLLDLKERIDEAKEKVSELKGRKQNLEEQLEEQYKCKTVAKGEELLEQKREEIRKLQKQIEEETNKLQEEYDL